MEASEILDRIEQMYPDAKAELHFRNSFELLIAVILSAQTTDVRVNLTTPGLFAAYPTVYDLAKADVNQVEDLIKQIGLYRMKAKNIIRCSQQIVEDFQGVVPENRKALMSLAGVGRKTANVVLSVAFDHPALAVDTHVDRVSKRLRLAKPTDTVEQVEQKLMRKIPRNRWNKAHHLLIFFGRYTCLAQRPKCETCPFTEFCRYYQKKNSSSS